MNLISWTNGLVKTNNSFKRFIANIHSWFLLKKRYCIFNHFKKNNSYLQFVPNKPIHLPLNLLTLPWITSGHQQTMTSNWTTQLRANPAHFFRLQGGAVFWINCADSSSPIQLSIILHVRFFSSNSSVVDVLFPSPMQICCSPLPKSALYTQLCRERRIGFPAIFERKSWPPFSVVSKRFADLFPLFCEYDEWRFLWVSDALWLES